MSKLEDSTNAEKTKNLVYQGNQAGLASLVGTVLEWYDFVIYGVSAALVLNKVFFPDIDPLMGTLAAFATYAVGFIVRPIGGIVLGHLGDKLGRKTVLMLTLFLMGISTTIIGFLPTYHTAGIWATISLIVLRLIQGFGAGGEYASAAVLSVEHAPKGKRGRGGAWAAVGFSLATLLAYGVYFLCLRLLGQDAFIAWGWRLPFIFGAVCVVFGFIVRLHIVEPPAFQKAKVAREETNKHIGLFSVFRRHPREVFIVVGSRMGENGFAYFYPVFILAYMTTGLGLSDDIGLWGVLIASVVQLIAIPFLATLSDKVGRKPIYKWGAILSIAWLIPFFLLINTGSSWAIILGFVVGLGLGYAGLTAAQASWYAELFEPDFRVSGFAVSYEIGSILAGGFAPLICTALYGWSGHWWPVAVYMAFLGLLTLIALALGPETLHKDIEITEE